MMAQELLGGAMRALETPAIRRSGRARRSPRNPLDNKARCPRRLFRQPLELTGESAENAQL